MITLDDFGRAIRFYRETLGFTQLDLAARGGPSNTTLTKIENGEGPAPSPSTLRKLDAAFGWPRGTARLVLTEGLAPSYADGAWTVPRTAAPPDVRASDALHAYSDRELLDEIGRRMAVTAGQRRLSVVPDTSSPDADEQVAAFEGEGVVTGVDPGTISR